jgi:hypothetical protein
MALLDHFHAPLFPRHRWESFHSRWANAIADYLDQQLPPRYFAEVQTHLSTRVEADVAEMERAPESEQLGRNGPGGGVAVQPWAPPVATFVLPAVFPDDLEVHVIDSRDDARLVAAVELVSPGNKDRDETRLAFAAKLATYLQQGIGLVTVDVVTTRLTNMHNELIELLRLDPQFRMADESSLSAVAYRPARRQEMSQIDVWPAPLTLGEQLPLLPLGLKGGPTVPLDLEATYSTARQRARL